MRRPRRLAVLLGGGALLAAAGMLVLLGSSPTPTPAGARVRPQSATVEVHAIRDRHGRDDPAPPPVARPSAAAHASAGGDMRRITVESAQRQIALDFALSADGRLQLRQARNLLDDTAEPLAMDAARALGVFYYKPAADNARTRDTSLASLSISADCHLTQPSREQLQRLQLDQTTRPASRLTANLTCADHLAVGLEVVLDAHAARISLNWVVLPPHDPARLHGLHVLGCSAVGVMRTSSLSGAPLLHRRSRLLSALEHPLAQAGQAEQHREQVLHALQPLPARPRGSASLLLCACPSLLLVRRAFQRYLLRRRPAPPEPLLHYNSWFDFYSWQEPDPRFSRRRMTEESALDRIESLAAPLAARGVQLDAFLFDDGWDNPNASTLWTFHSGFPDGFRRVRAAAAAHHAGLGVWLSPWGGYGEAKEQRMRAASKQGYQTSEDGFSLTDAHYRARFLAIAQHMVTEEGVAMLKIDGVAGVDLSSSYVAEMQAMLDLIAELRTSTRAARRRQRQRRLFINLTTGTWPSPFFLLTADSIWRGFADLCVHGPGRIRQQWVTCRDAVVLHKVVRRSVLFPLSALMLHGIVVGAVGQARVAGLDRCRPLPDFADEVWSYFAMGVVLQELYLSADHMEPACWDVVAEAAAWASRHATTLSDSHWLFGDPVEGEVYAYGAVIGEWFESEAGAAAGEGQGVAESDADELAGMSRTLFRAATGAIVMARNSNDRPGWAQVTLGPLLEISGANGSWPVVIRYCSAGGDGGEAAPITPADLFFSGGGGGGGGDTGTGWSPRDRHALCARGRDQPCEVFLGAPVFLRLAGMVTCVLELGVV